jgi:uncharacterized Zn-binding protein involved in type VI secretion
MHTCPMVTVLVPHVGGPILPPGAPTVLINFLPAATVTSMATCVGPPDIIVKGSAGVFINFMPAARMGDMTAHGGVIIMGSPNVIIGEIGTPSPGAVGLGGIVAGLAVSNPMAAGKGGHHPGHHSSPCAGKGLATPANEKEFAKDMKTLQKDWPNLTPAQREARMETITNRQLGKSGLPPVKVRDNPSLSPQTNGQMNFQDWSLDMNPALSASPSLSNAQTEQLGNTLYHESRHAEQWYLIARSEAANGKSGADIAASTSMPLSVTNAAAAHPLGAKDPMHACAQTMYNSVYGKGAAHRNKTLTDLPKLNAAYEKAAATNNQVQSNPASTAAQKQAAQAAADHAYKDAMNGYNQYRTLPEEADAWHAGDSVGKLLH